MRKESKGAVNSDKRVNRKNESTRTGERKQEEH